MNKRSTIRSTDLPGIGIVKFDSDMPIGSLRKLFGAANSGDLGELIQGLSEFVTEWPFGGKPSNPEAWDVLRKSEFQAITEAIMAELGEAGEE